MILDMRKTYKKYLDQAKKGNNQCDQIRICALSLKQDLSFNNEEKKRAVDLF